MRKAKAGRRSTIYDIAEAAGISASTVSLVMNGSWERYRIHADTAGRVLKAAEAVGYNANQRARGLRLQRSSLAGMIIPHYRNRFFAGLAETFEARARERGLCPIVVSTQRDDATERQVTETLIAQAVECLIFAGVNRPDPLNQLCIDAGIACVNLDLPGAAAPSVVTDNRGGSTELTLRLIDMVAERGGDPAQIQFVGGRRGEFATDERMIGFEAAFAARQVAFHPESILPCGYQPSAAQEVFARLADHAPPGIFVNSITALEGLARLVAAGRWPASTVLGCFDWDPFAYAMPLPVIMMRQDVEELIRHCFAVFDGPGVPPGSRIVVPPRDAAAHRPPGAELA
ncbi:LacI family DNA-binding transcriptional regulator [Aureimonas frigidaquae]|nr:LacI family DNA-binding transcriptional regulator [Aureimonas frigidaquae]